MWPNSRNTNPTQRWYLRNSVNFRYRREISTLSLLISFPSRNVVSGLLENVCLSKLWQDFHSVPAALESGPRAQGWRWHRRWCSSPINRKPGRRGAAVACGALESLTHPSLTLSYGHSVVLLCSRYLILLARYSTVDFPNNNVNFCSPSSTLTRKGRFECKPLD